MGRRVSVGKEQSGEEIEVEISADSGIRSRARIRLDARIIRRRRLERLGKGQEERMCFYTERPLERVRRERVDWYDKKRVSYFSKVVLVCFLIN